MELNPKQELFCQSYVNNWATFGNATKSYVEAYDVEEESARREGSRLLTKVDVKARVVKLLNDLLKDEIVDAELSKVIQQDNDLSVKVSAIKEYNKLRQRITDKVDMTTKGESMASITEEQFQKILDSYVKRTGKDSDPKKNI